MSHPKKSFISDSPFAFVVVPLSITAVTAAVLFAFGYAMVSPYLSMLRWFSDRTEEYQSQDLLSQASSVLDGSADAENTQETLPLSSITYPNVGDRYADITISGTTVDAPVYYGDNNKILNKGVGTYVDSDGVGIPGEGVTIMMAAHNNTFFNDLQHAEVGATVTVTTHYGVYTYEITDTKVLDYQDTSAYDFSRQDENLILYTCYPFDALGFTPNRFFVYAKYISGPVIDRTC